MDKKVLIIINPCSGTKRANKFLTDIVEMSVRSGYFPTVLTTTKSGDGTEYAEKYAGENDLVMCIGGDGTFNEVAAGIIACKAKTRLGYVPSGTTNDFASSLNLSRDVLKAAKNTLSGESISVDMGRFNNRYFSYVASFGAFTNASYNTPQSTKNLLGHFAYILQGMGSLSSIKKVHMKLFVDNIEYEDDYIFGAISNSTSIAGILTIRPELVDMNDGKFELLLVRAPKDIMELTELVRMISVRDFGSNMLTFISGKKFEIEADETMAWTLDGEYQEGSKKIVIETVSSAINLVVPKGGIRA